jgi:hypothetical protein
MQSEISAAIIVACGAIVAALIAKIVWPKRKNVIMPGITIKKYANFVFSTTVDNLLNKATKEIIIIGGPMLQLVGSKNKITYKENLKIRLLALDIENPEIAKAYYKITKGATEVTDLKHLKEFTDNRHIEVRVYETLPTVYFIAADINENNGLIIAAHIFTGVSELEYLHIEIERSNSEWYEAYRRQIEALWDGGKQYNKTTETKDR